MSSEERQIKAKEFLDKQEIPYRVYNDTIELDLKDISPEEMDELDKIFEDEQHAEEG